MKIVTMRLEKEEHQRLKDTAEQFGMNVSAFIRFSIADKTASQKSLAAIEELSDLVATEVQALRQELALLKQDTAQVVASKVQEANDNLSKQLNSGFAFELDRMHEDMKKLLLEFVSIKSTLDLPRPVQPPTSR